MRLWGTGGRNKPPTVDQFQERHKAVVGPHGLDCPADVPAIAFRISAEAHRWVHYEAMFAVPGHSVNTLYNVAILAATFRLFAEHEGLVPFLTAQGDAHAERHGLPPLPPTGPLPGDEVDHFTLALPARDAVRWLLRDESDDYHLANPIDHGLRIIGALALMPPGSGIAVQDSHDKVYGYAPPLILEGLDPYPAGFGFAGMPPQQ